MTTGLFAFALGIGTVGMPLLALSRGYSGAQVGLFVALSAVAQMVVRLFCGPVMRRLSDRSFVGAAGVLMAVAFGALALFGSVEVFVAAQILDGVARALFWTGSQTHVIRGSGPSAGPLALVNFTTAVGMSAGPAVAGALSEGSPTYALVAAAGVAFLSSPFIALMTRHSPFPARKPEEGTSRLWRERGGNAACLANASAGAWRALLSSFVPVALAEARQPPGTIGVLLSLANFASVLGATVVARVRPRWLPPVFAAATLAAAGGIGCVSLVAGGTLAVGLALLLSGLGGGALQTLGPAVAADRVPSGRKGEAMAVLGVFRSGASCAAPLAVAAALPVVPLAAAMALAGLVIALPTLTARQLGCPPPEPPRMA
jgi:MFS family permease